MSQTVHYLRSVTKHWPLGPITCALFASALNADLSSASLGGTMRVRLSLLMPAATLVICFFGFSATAIGDTWTLRTSIKLIKTQSTTTQPTTTQPTTQPASELPDCGPKPILNTGDDLADFENRYWRWMECILGLPPGDNCGPEPEFDHNSGESRPAYFERLNAWEKCKGYPITPNPFQDGWVGEM